MDSSWSLLVKLDQCKFRMDIMKADHACVKCKNKGIKYAAAVFFLPIFLPKIPNARIYSQSVENVRPHSSNFFWWQILHLKHQGPVVRRPISA